MKKLFVFPIVLAVIMLGTGCGSKPLDPPTAEEYDRVHDSVSAAVRGFTDWCLENMMHNNSETDFLKVYGPDTVSYDTIWGAEGFFTMGTVIRLDTVSRIEALWLNDSTRSGLVSLTLVSEADFYAQKVPAASIGSCTGIKLGMSLEEVEKINGRPFSFSGFGWDYAGGLMSWEGGTLEDKGISIQMAEGTGYDSLPENEYTKILGDVPVMSNNETARKSGARVWSISVAKVQ